MCDDEKDDGDEKLRKEEEEGCGGRFENPFITEFQLVNLKKRWNEEEITP